MDGKEEDKFVKLDTKSTEADLYLFRTDYVVKVPKKEPNDRELKIGLKFINPLRKIVPNYVQTFGTVKFGKKDSIVLGKIDGYTLEFALKNDLLTFGDFKNIFSQILLALEVGGRECNLCHYDLHCGNVLLQKLTDPYPYKVLINDKVYNIVAQKYLAFIIDFGLASVSKNDQTIGTNSFVKYGMLSYPLPGVDMYKLLFYSVVHSNERIKNDIKGLFSFYGDRDPYSMVTISPMDILKARSLFIRNIASSVVATYIPLQFYLFLHPSSGDPRDKVFLSKPEELKIDFPPNYSYVMALYISKVKKSKSMVQTDKNIMFKYEDIIYPNEIELRDKINRILTVSLHSTKDETLLLSSFKNLILFTDKLSPYLQYMYTIRELKLKNKVYKTFLSKFTSSEVYKLYSRTITDIDRALRWSVSLERREGTRRQPPPEEVVK